MEEKIEWNWDVKGIPVINFDRNCSHCINSRIKSCPKKQNEFLETYASIFCEYFKENPRSKVPVPTIDMENLQGPFGYITYDSEMIVGIFTYSGGEENQDTYYSYKKEMKSGDQVERFLKELDSLKGKGSTPEAKKLRRELRKIGFHLKTRKEVTENDTML